MNRKKIFHMNINEKNIFVDSRLIFKINGFYKSIDFSNYEPNDLFRFPIRGKGQYLSPEVLNKDKIEIKNGNKIDLYSLGVTLYKLIFGCYPNGLSSINGENYDETKEKILTSKAFKIHIGMEISKKLENFLKKVLEKDHRKRYSINDALNDPWIKGWDILNEEKENDVILDVFILRLLENHIPKFNQYFKFG